MIDNRGKLVISRRHLHDLLNLHEDIEVTGFYCTHDPKYLMVELRGAPLAQEDTWGPWHPDDCEAKIVKIEDVR